MKSTSLDCNEKFLVYLLTCNYYQKQYVVQIVDIFRNKCNNYKYNARKVDRGNTGWKGICMNTFHYQDSPVFFMMCLSH